MKNRSFWWELSGDALDFCPVHHNCRHRQIDIRNICSVGQSVLIVEYQNCTIYRVEVEECVPITPLPAQTDGVLILFALNHWSDLVVSIFDSFVEEPPITGGPGVQHLSSYSFHNIRQKCWCRPKSFRRI